MPRRPRREPQNNNLIDLYRWLGFSYQQCRNFDEITDAEVGSAYRKQTLKYHPDRLGPNPDPDLAKDASGKLLFFQQVYKILSDPTERIKWREGKSKSIQEKLKDIFKEE